MSHNLSNHFATNCSDPTAFESYCVVCGGGGARGMAHLGALHAVAEQNVPVGRMVGVSMGALMGAFCLVERDTERAQRLALEFLHSAKGQKLRSSVAAGSGLSMSAKRRWGTGLVRKIIKHAIVSKAVNRAALLPGKILSDLIHPLIPDIDIRDLSTPLQIAAVDLLSGQRVVLSSGSLRLAIRASMSIPGIFPAVRYGDQLLSDIGAYDIAPTDIAADSYNVESGTEGTLVIDVGRRPEVVANCKNAIAAVLRSQVLAEHVIRQKSLANADIVIQPNLQAYHRFDFSSPDSMIAAGYKSATKVLTSTASTWKTGSDTCRVGIHRVQEN